jgi:hypothetical protein
MRLNCCLPKEVTMDKSNAKSSESAENLVIASLCPGETLREACFSPEGNAVAYITSSDRHYFVRNGNGTRVAYDDARSLVVGPGGETTACKARLGNEAFVPISGTYGRTFQWVSDPVLCPDGKSAAFYGMLADASSPYSSDDQSFFIVMGDALHGPYKSSGHLSFNPITGHMVYTIQRQGDSFVRGEGSEGPHFDRVLQPIFHPADGSLWYWAYRSPQWLLIRNHEVIDVSDECPVPGGPFFYTAGRHTSYWKCQRGRWTLTLNGRPVGAVERPLDIINSVAVTDSGQVAYAFQSVKGVWVNVDGQEQGPFDAVGAPTFSHDGARMAFLARRSDKSYLVLDGLAGEPFDAILP